MANRLVESIDGARTLNLLKTILIKSIIFSIHVREAVSNKNNKWYSELCTNS